MNEDYLYEDKKYQEIVILLKKIYSSLFYTAPEAMENKYYLLAEKYGRFFTFPDLEKYAIKRWWNERGFKCGDPTILSERFDTLEEAENHITKLNKGTHNKHGYFFEAFHV